MTYRGVGGACLNSVEKTFAGGSLEWLGEEAN